MRGQLRGRQETRFLNMSLLSEVRSNFYGLKDGGAGMQKPWWGSFQLHGFGNWQFMVICDQGDSAPDLLLGKWTIHFWQGSGIQTAVLSWSFGSIPKGKTSALGVIWGKNFLLFTWLAAWLLVLSCCLWIKLSIILSTE